MIKKKTRRALDHLLNRSFVHLLAWLTHLPHCWLYSCTPLCSFPRTLAHWLAPELMGKRFLSMKWTRWFHTFLTRCALEFWKWKVRIWESGSWKVETGDFCEWESEDSKIETGKFSSEQKERRKLKNVMKNQKLPPGDPEFETQEGSRNIDTEIRTGCSLLLSLKSAS